MRDVATVFAVCAAAAVLAEPALTQSGPVKRLNWFWSIFAGFVLAGIGIALIAWLFNLMRGHWSIVLVLWIVVTLFLRYDTHL